MIRGNLKCCRLISRILFHPPQLLSAEGGYSYHLSVAEVTLRDQSAYPVSRPVKNGTRTSRPQRYYTWHFSLQGLPAIDVTIKSCGLLPHIFTLSSQTPFPQSGKGTGTWLFSVALSVPACAGPGSSPVQCPVLSGLSFLTPMRGTITSLQRTAKITFLLRRI